MNKIVLSLLVIVLITSCNKDKCSIDRTLYKYTANYKPMATLRTIAVQAPKAIASNGKMYIKGNYIYLNETDKGFHVIDNSNPTSPRNIAFVAVPGNLDLSGSGNYLLADNYIDLLTFDISNPANITLANRKEGALPYRIYNYGFSDDSARGIIVNFNKEIATEKIDCNQVMPWRRGFEVFSFSSSAAFISGGGEKAANTPGQSGSLSRFAILNNYLYIANRFTLTPINISNPVQPLVKAAVGAGEIETIFPFQNHLLLGTPTGMRIYGTSNADVPNYISQVRHGRGCDPVVAKDNIAYVTLRGGGPCGGVENILDILDVTNLQNPIRIKTVQLTNPYGLGVNNNNVLAVCDGNAGVKLYNVASPANITQIGSINESKFFDVIMLANNTAVFIGKDGLYQYNIATPSNPQFISKIAIAL